MQNNSPDLWKTMIPVKTGNKHKYNYGHAVIYGAPDLTGATRLAAESCARIGTGLVTVLSQPSVADIYKETLAPHIMVRDDLKWMDERVSARLYGSGGLVVEPDYDIDMPTVLDADALDKLPVLTKNYVLTPHEGEFKRVFADLEGSKEHKAMQAAQKSQAIVVLKGEETVIASPDERLVVNAHASPHLATAGSGDVLAGMITGFLAQGMPSFEAACAAVWIHGECGLQLGQGLVASDIPKQIPVVIQKITNNR